MKIERLKTDLLIIGGGTAGCYAAITAAQNASQEAVGLKILIVEKANIKRSGCLAAGVNALNAYITEGRTPKDYVGALMTLCDEKRGEFETMEYLDEEKVILKYNLPLAEIMFDFYDRLKSVSRGYAGLDYAPSEYRRNNLGATTSSSSTSS